MRDVRVRIWLYLAVLATGLSFSTVFTGEAAGSAAYDAPGQAFEVMLGATLVALAVGSAGKYRFVLIPPATILYTMLVVYGFPPVRLSGWRSLFWEVRADIYEAGNVMYLEPVPYDVFPGLLLVMVPLAMVLVAFATSMTLYERSPVISVVVLGVTVAIISTSSFETGAGPYFLVFLVSAVGLLLNAGSGRENEGPGRPAVVAGTVLVLLVLALPRLPYADLTVSPGLVDWTNVGSWGASNLDVQADVGDYLNSGRESALLRVNSSEPLRWRGGTLDYFDGVRWSDTTAPDEADGEEIASGVPTRYVEQRVEVLNARSDRVFGGYKILQTSLENATENSDGSWSVEEPLEGGDTYRVISEVPQPTEEQMRGAGTNYPASVRERFLQLPENLPQEVPATARRIERGYDTNNRYDAARAIEQYLLYDGGFTYNLDADYRRADRALEKFLGEDGDREGFCTQFATSMALIARENGIPSRVVYGSTQGEPDGINEYLVRGSNMHTWVEIYFPGIGWYPFDPTPGFAVPETMESNAPRPVGPIDQQDFLPQEFGPEQRELDEDPAEEVDPEASGSSANRESSTPLWPVVALVPVLLLAIPAAKRGLLARGRPEDLYRDLTGRLRDVLTPGRGSIADSPALTPTERVLLLAGAAGLDEEPFKDFARAYSDHLYSPNPSPDVEGAYHAAIREFRRLPRWRLVLGEINPASLVARTKGGLAGAGTRVRKALAGPLRKVRQRKER
ncbi:MAG: transglutaminaseTgpA domain-containing protein [Rubrobacteraceae bacterium]